MMLRRHPGMVIVVAAVCLVFLSAVALTLHRQAEPTNNSSRNGGPRWHTAHSSFGLSDSRFAIAITKADRDAHPAGTPIPPNDHHYVTIAVDFTNRSTDQQLASPIDFSLIADGTTRTPTFVPGTACARWRVADLHPAGEASAPPRDADAQQVGPNQGPKTLCFLAGGSPSATMTLVWNPDVSIFLLGQPTTVSIG
ncbi:MAG TPA: hypothetical protein VIA06_16010 [Candidatus Dormibacteraeota bacterium]|jgi:hypothetical protein|nr:hypothetical protein [Candidatus Dormibacteraeota bacterium]